mgnify:CR=1 FL=1|tara:strand:- start:6943 stop:7884 length:942 start_codon:yes stop_codon:yes gene_type:complete
MQEIIDDMNYVIDKYKTMVQEKEDFEGYSVEATEEVLNNAVDDGVFADYETVRDRRLAMVEYLNERLKCQSNAETSEPTEEVEETEEATEPNLPELMQEIFTLDYVKDVEEVLRNGEQIFEAGMAAIRDDKDPREAMLDIVHEFVSPPTETEEVEEPTEEVEVTTEEETVEPIVWGDGLELNEPFEPEAEEEVEVNHEEIMETYEAPAPMFEGLIETDALFEKKETLLVDTEGREIPELGETLRSQVGPVPAQVLQTEAPPEMVSIFVKEKEVERKIIEIVNEFDDTLGSLGIYLERLQTVNQAVKRRVNPKG